MGQNNRPEIVCIKHKRVGMNRSFWIAGFLVGVWIGVTTADDAVPCTQPAASAPAAGDQEVLLFTSFRGNGEDGLYLAWSEDGYQWTPLNGDKPLLKPEVGRKPLMRDPCITRGPDGLFHIVWTTSWGTPLLIGYAHSRDLRHWSPQRGLAVMEHEPTARNAWAPEIFYDEARSRFVIVWSSTIPGRFSETAESAEGDTNHRAYCTTTTDFRTLSPSRLLYDGGFNCIDATLLKLDKGYGMVVKDETLKPVRKHLRMAFADTAEGLWRDLTEPFTISWVEGPSAIRIGDYWYVYFDHYVEPHYYGAVRSRDFKTWEDVSKKMSFPPGHRHGTVLRIPRSLIGPLSEEHPPQ